MNIKEKYSGPVISDVRLLEKGKLRELEKINLERMVVRLAWALDLMGVVMRQPGISVSDAAKSLSEKTGEHVTHQRMSRAAMDLVGYGAITKEHGRKNGGRTTLLYPVCTGPTGCASPRQKTVNKSHKTRKTGGREQNIASTNTTPPSTRGRAYWASKNTTTGVLGVLYKMFGRNQ